MVKRPSGFSKSPGARIDLVATDVVMPVMGGPELGERLASLKPGIRVLYLSGYADDAVFRHRILDGNVPFLAKPYSRRALAARVRQVLDSEAPLGVRAAHS